MADTRRVKGFVPQAVSPTVDHPTFPRHTLPTG
jgi:hypothetical protein